MTFDAMAGFVNAVQSEQVDLAVKLLDAAPKNMFENTHRATILVTFIDRGPPDYLSPDARKDMHAREIEMEAFLLGQGAVIEQQVLKDAPRYRQSPWWLLARLMQTCFNQAEESQQFEAQDERVGVWLAHLPSPAPEAAIDTLWQSWHAAMIRRGARPADLDPALQVMGKQVLKRLLDLNSFTQANAHVPDESPFRAWIEQLNPPHDQSLTLFHGVAPAKKRQAQP
jgi:hypothetical protein